jgi:putative FmdB family regulatory protein
MPVYEYACTECDTRLEVRQSFTDESLTICPQCSGRLRKLLSPVGVVFKGSGFYRNDSRSAPPAETPAASSGDGTSSGAKDSDGAAPTKDGNGAAKSTPAKESTPHTPGSTGSAKSNNTKDRTAGAGAGSKAAR